MPPPEIGHASQTVLAVYGTLRRGGSNHRLLVDGGARFIGVDTLDGFDLFAGNDPLLTRGSGRAVVELYSVGPELLNAVDALEEHPTLYVRTLVMTRSGRAVQAYLFPRDRIPAGAVAIDGDWIEWMGRAGKR